MGTFETSLDDLGNVIERGLRHDLKGMIKGKLYSAIDQILEDMAIEIANNIVLRAESFRSAEPFNPETRVIVNFNLKDPPMVYDTKTKEVKRRDVLSR